MAAHHSQATAATGVHHPEFHPSYWMTLGIMAQHAMESSQFSGTVRHDAARGGRPFQTTQIYEGTNQIQRMVIAKQLFS